ncbi:MAG: peptide deformylase [Herpetosiphonaceae bacterium]|nr:peptide deformylase [Herpetosiphonaceae bacterium]
MAVRPTLELGNPALHQPAQPVADAVDPAVQALIADLHDTLQAWRAAHGWAGALSAPAIGVNQRVVIIERAAYQYILINPAFEQWSQAHTEAFESCITFPSIWGHVSRPAEVIVTALDAAGAPLRIHATGDLARILQHEIDHLDGFVWLDRDPDLTSICTTAEYRRRYKM